MSVHPFNRGGEAFFEAEKQGGHGVKRPCELLGGSVLSSTHAVMPPLDRGGARWRAGRIDRPGPRVLLG